MIRADNINVTNDFCSAKSTVICHKRNVLSPPRSTGVSFHGVKKKGVGGGFITVPLFNS